MIPENKIICGAMPEATRVFPNGHFNCCISSPPYWALRDYGVDGQLGLEPTFEEYIDKLCTIYDEVKRVLRDDGTCWVNLGDTYSSSTKGDTRTREDYIRQGATVGALLSGAQNVGDKVRKIETNISDKSLCLIPQRFAIEMVNRGWILRNVIIWHKPNPMPSSAKDRFTVDFEYVYFFVKSKKYWFEPQYEPHTDPEGSRNRAKYDGHNSCKRLTRKDQYRPDDNTFNPLGRNKRTVWTIPTQPFPEAHFATFPEKLVEPMIKAGCPEFVCTKCGKGREKIQELQYEKAHSRGDNYKRAEGTNSMTSGKAWKDGGWNELPALKISGAIFKGYTDCGCNAEWRPGIVLDCFCRKLYDRQGRCQAA